MIKVEVKTETAHVKEGLEELGVNLKAGLKMILAALATAAKNRVQQRMGSYIGFQTGWLKKHVYGRRRSESHYAVAAPRFMAEILEKGGTIKPSKRKYLTFVGDDGELRRMKQVTIQARHWFSRSYAGFEDSPEYNQAIDKGLEKALRKFNGGPL